MKRLSRVGLLVVLLASITACGGSPSSPSGMSSPPATVAGVTLAHISLVGGESTMGTVTLENAASSAGARIELSAGDPSIIVPADISVPAGSKSATFPVTTSAVNGYVDTPVAATLNGITRSVLIHLSPPPVIGLVSMLKTPVKGGESVAVHVQFFPNPGFAGINGFNVALSSNNPAAMVPTSLVIQNGLGGANAVVTTSSVTRETTVLISASGGGVTLSTILTIQP